MTGISRYYSVSYHVDIKRLDPKQLIAGRIALCNGFKIHFWSTVGLFSTAYNTKRLKALYTGQSIKEFEKKHKRPDLHKKFESLLKCWVYQLE